ncbi:glycosyltransferase [Vibrio sp. S4M6]|uniref:glycosyltransferase n=1 Tax=Vibrio sinus TaxID=2946865 RepID=UPI00202A8B48|nr:polysaccharide deacetylase family protein [Vibrio sinus]MCL9780368.1 glycosyltransferase [Vibrio sinus]
MNILMALSQLEITGAEVYATTLGNELSDRGHNVHYVSDTLTKPHKGPFYRLKFNKRSIPRRLWHVGFLVYIIKKYKIQIVHAHSRASSWSCHLACKLTRTPMVTTVHGRQPVHSSSKRFHAMGDKALPVCEAIKEQLITELGIPEKLLTISRNGIDTCRFTRSQAPKNSKPVICIIGRLTGPKGELCYRLLKECLDVDKYQIRVVTGSAIEKRFNRFQPKVEFIGYSKEIPAIMEQSDLVIGAGRVAMESILCGRPTLAVGESRVIGAVTEHNVLEAMASNFGDIGPRDLDIDFQLIKDEVEKALKSSYCSDAVTEKIAQSYNLKTVADHIEDIYQTIYIEKLKREIPIIMYHRFIKNDNEKGVHGTYLHVDMLEKHLKLLKKMNFETLTFDDFSNKRLIDRLEYGKKYIIITVDDGYKDNYELLFPLLKKYSFKAVIYAVSGEQYNKWDVDVPESRERKVPLMTHEELKELSNSGLVEIGGHTISHPHLNTLSVEEQKKEIFINKYNLETIIEKPLTSFAYPYGSLCEETKSIVLQAGYKFAVATNSGPLLLHKDLLQIRRIGIFPKTTTFGLWRKVRGNYLYKKYNNNSGV